MGQMTLAPHLPKKNQEESLAPIPSNLLPLQLEGFPETPLNPGKSRSSGPRHHELRLLGGGELLEVLRCPEGSAEQTRKGESFNGKMKRKRHMLFLEHLSPTPFAPSHLSDAPKTTKKEALFTRVPKHTARRGPGSKTHDRPSPARRPVGRPVHETPGHRLSLDISLQVGRHTSLPAWAGRGFSVDRRVRGRFHSGRRDKTGDNGRFRGGWEKGRGRRDRPKKEGICVEKAKWA